MRLRSRVDRQWSWIRLRARRRTISPAFFGIRANLTKPMQLRARQQSCSQIRLQAVDGRFWLQFNAGIRKPRYAKRNRNPTRATAVSNLRLRNLRAEIERPRMQL